MMPQGKAMNIGCALLMTLSAMCGGCGRDSNKSAASTLIHSPPIGQLTSQQLRSLSMECEKYTPGKLTRGPYDAAYCDAAIAAWSDAPLELVRIPSPPADQTNRN
jgi:hypothetical protein